MTTATSLVAAVADGRPTPEAHPLRMRGCGDEQELRLHRRFPAPTLRLGVLLLLVSIPAVGSIALPELLPVSFALDALLLLAAVADAVLLPPRNWATVRRCLPSGMQVRTPAEVEVRIDNRFAVRARLRFMDSPPPGLHAEHDPTGEMDLAPGTTVGATYSLLPSVRGDHRFGRLHLRLRGPLGLLLRQEIWVATQTARVHLALPRNVGRFQLARRLAGAQGLHAQRRAGIGGDFDSLRPYHVGDDARLIDWKATARRGDLITRQYTLERDQTVVLAVDRGRQLLGEEDGLDRIEWVLQAVLSVASEAIEVGDRVGVALLGVGPATVLPPATGAAHLARIRSFLFDVQANDQDADLARGLASLRETLQRRCLIMLATDVNDEGSGQRLREALRPLLGRHLVVVAALQDATIQHIADKEPGDVQEAAEETLAVERRRQRTRLLSQAAALGVPILDTAAPALSLALLNQYQRIKQRGSL